ncbi:AAA family ATPase [Stenotrophomonas sp. ZAC14A_NAIMI4_1]|uniref:AAA family ATPase n=1 Tax=Stenotrophomonas sp. ZAC14A_NAIMI4_1 TaxID=2072412 RepID=UPI00131EFA11|nr:AAA family ATPase [Stenotrophomonas sp. ZAC14A_NAIMI4_1]
MNADVLLADNEPDCLSSTLFKASAIKLLVGPNGSGKTETLRAIANAVVSEDGEAALSDAPLADYHAIYFSPSHFGAAQIAGTDRLDVLDNSRRPARLNPRSKILTMLKDSFGFSNSLHVKLKFSSRSNGFSGLTLIVSALRKLSRSTDPSQIDQPVRTLVDKIRRHDDEAVANRSQWTASGVSANSWLESDAWRQLRANGLELRRDVEELVRSRAGDAYPLLLRALAQTIKHVKRDRADATLHLMGEFGIPISTKSRPTAMKLFKKSKAQLEILADRVRDPALAQDSYQINHGSIDDGEVSDVADIDYLHSSSGLAALINQISQINSAVERARRTGHRRLIVLIDEGDSFLHIEWQRRYVKFIDDYVGTVIDGFESIQVIIATHSPILMSDFPRDLIHRFPSDPASLQLQGATEQEEIHSFAAPLEAIVRTAAGTGTIGALAAACIDELFEKIDRAQSIPEWRIRMIDDPILRSFFERYVSR